MICGYFSKQGDLPEPGTIERMLGRLDQNKDGSVTSDEVDAYIDALFNGADGDKDGGLTLAEIRATPQKRPRQSDAKGN